MDHSTNNFVECVLLNLAPLLIEGSMPPGYIPDCDGNCHLGTWLGDRVCDDRLVSPANFMCAEYNWDYGDCSDCDFPMLEDCNGNCNSLNFLGTGTCNDDGVVNFNCATYNWDSGDCPISGCTDTTATNYNPDASVDDGSCYYTTCPEGEFADCDGNCWPLVYLNLLSNWHCNNTVWNAAGWDYIAGQINLNCEEWNFDEGDCMVWGCGDPLALNYYEHVTHDDGSCFYGDCPEETTDCMGFCVPENWIGTNACVNGLDGELEDHLFNGAYPAIHEREIILESPAPRGMCVLPNGSAAFAATESGLVRVELDPFSTCVEQQTLGSSMYYTCDTSVDGQYVVGAKFSQGGIDVFETSTNTLITSLSTGAGALKVRCSNTGEWFAISNHDAHTVTIVDGQSFEIIANIPVGFNPRNVAFSPDDNRLYVANWGSASMSVIETSSWTVTNEVHVDYWPQAVWAMPNDDYVLVAKFGFDLTYDHISVIRISDWEVIARLKCGVGPEDLMSIGPNGEYLYTSNWGKQCCFGVNWDYCCTGENQKGSISVIATPVFNYLVPPDVVPDPIPYLETTLTTIQLGSEYTFGMDIHPDGSKVYAVNRDSNSMSVIGLGDIPEDNTEGDLCDNAKPLVQPSFCFSDCTVGMNDNYNESCPFEITGAPDIVYCFDATFDQTVNIDLCSSGYDTKIYIYEDQCESYNSGNAVYCNDDFCGINGWRSRLDEVVFSAGHSYFIVVDGYGSADTGNFEMCFENPCPGDFNGDLLVNINDLLLFLGGFGSQFNTEQLLQFFTLVGQVCN